MTKDEFKFQFKRLCDGTKHEATPEQIDAWWSRLQHVRADDWRESVTALLLVGRFPYPEKVNEAIDQAVAARKTEQQRKEQAEAKKFFAGTVIPSGRSEQERAYNRFRMSLLVQTFGQDWPDRCRALHWREAHPDEACPDCQARQRAFAQRQARSLAEWISDPDHANWAAMMQQGPCHLHPYPHTLHRCIADEFHFWELRAAGKTDAEAREAIMGAQV